MPRVSVVIPTYNRARLLGRAVKSVLRQTFADIEVLIADDASADDTEQMVLGLRDSRIRYLRHDTNRGVSAARNTALSCSSGEYVAFLDDDDEWLPDKLRMQLDRFEHQDSSVGIMTSGYYVVDAGNERVAFEVIPSQRGWIFESLMSRGWFYHTSTVLMRAECLDTVGVFDVTFPFGEDFDMWLRIAKAYQVDFVPMPLAWRYIQPKGLTRNYNATISGIEAHLAKYREFFDAHPDVFSNRLNELGTCYCLAGRGKNGREAFCKSIVQAPLAMKSYIGVLLSFTGPHTIRWLYKKKAMLTG